VVDGSRCISYYTIELKGAMPVEVKGKLADWMFGCDVCQSVCPWNSHAERHTEPKFEPDERILKFTRKDWTDLTEEVFHEIFKGTPVKRTGYAGLKRNVEALRPIPD
jgi:epoxyqueuosine reductase